MFYLENLYPDLPIILVTRHCDAMSEEGTFKKEGFIVVHRMKEQSIMEGEPWKEELRC